MSNTSSDSVDTVLRQQLVDIEANLAFLGEQASSSRERIATALFAAVLNAEVQAGGSMNRESLRLMAHFCVHGADLLGQALWLPPHELHPLPEKRR